MIVRPSQGVQTQIDARLAQQIASDLVGDLRLESAALRTRNRDKAASAAGGPRLQGLWQQIDAAGKRAIIVPERRVQRLQLELEAAVRQDPPLVIADVTGTERLLTVSGTPPTVAFRGNETSFERTLELQLDGGRYVIVGSRGGTPEPVAVASARLVSTGVGGAELRDVAIPLGIDFRQQGFRTAATADVVSMMGGGVCWLDVDNDGWLDLYAVNSYADRDLGYWQQHGGPPRNALYRNVRGMFTDVSRRSRSDLSLRGNGCVAGDLNGDGFTDLYVTAAGYDALLWNDGHGHFSEGARTAGITAYGWHTGATVGDVNGDGRPDLFVSGYADPNAQIPGSEAGFPNNYAGVRDLLYLNTGNDAHGHARFREVGEKAGIDTRVEHALGAVFSDLNGDGRLDLYVANDANPNRLYLNVPSKGGLGFELEERAASAGLADPNAGMGIAAGDYSGDGRPDLLVTNSHKQLHGVFRSNPPDAGTASYSDARADIAPAFDTSLAGWGDSWVDLDNDTNLDLVLANGAIPVAGLRAECRAGAGVREPDRARAPGRVRVGNRGRRPRRGSAGQRPRARGGRLRQRRPHRHRCLVRGRAPGAAPQHGRARELARSRAAALRPGRSRHGGAPGRPPPRAGAPCGQQLPLVGGSPRALRARQGDDGERARRALPGRAPDASHRDLGEPGRDARLSRSGPRVSARPAHEVQATRSLKCRCARSSQGEITGGPSRITGRISGGERSSPALHASAKSTSLRTHPDSFARLDQKSRKTSASRMASLEPLDQTSPGSKRATGRRRAAGGRCGRTRPGGRAQPNSRLTETLFPPRPASAYERHSNASICGRAGAPGPAVHRQACHV